MSYTFAMIKPDATLSSLTGKIIDKIEANGFEIVEIKKMTLPQGLAEAFYNEHAQKPFFPEVIEFMTSGPIVAMILNKRDGVNAWRDLMGSTNPSNAAPDTIRALFGTSIMKNATHGSDSDASASREIGLIFQKSI